MIWDLGLCTALVIECKVVGNNSVIYKYTIGAFYITFTRQHVFLQKRKIKYTEWRYKINCSWCTYKTSYGTNVKSF